MTEQLLNISIGLLTTLLGYIVGRIWQKFSDQIPSRRTRKLWGALLADGLQLVVSRLESTFDPAGMVGGGDALALREISSHLASAGVKKLEIVYVDENSLDRDKNLILLGGPDTNAVTKEALEKIKPGVQIFNPRISPMEVRDLVPNANTGRSGTIRRRRRYAARPDLDYGIIVRARNPFYPRKWLVIIAGAYGYGSWAGAILMSDDNFLKRCNELNKDLENSRAQRRTLIGAIYRRVEHSLRSFGSPHDLMPFECVFEVGVHGGRPDQPHPIFIRGIRGIP
jgi:hypothetical protein